MPGAQRVGEPESSDRPNGVTRVLVLSDTHVGEGQAHRLLDRLVGELAAADVILHAGDITHASVLAELSRFAPVHAVLGNNDHGVRLPERRIAEVAGCTVAMVHDSGDATGRTARLRRWFPDADVVVFGHSHLPWAEADRRASDGHVQHHLNPGSATQRRRAPHCTVGWIEIEAGRVVSIEHRRVG